MTLGFAGQCPNSSDRNAEILRDEVPCSASHTHIIQGHKETLVFMIYTGIPHFIILCRVLQTLQFFYEAKICGNPVLAESVGIIFSTACTYFTSSVLHFGNSCNISNFFIIIILSVMVISV